MSYSTAKKRSLARSDYFQKQRLQTGFSETWKNGEVKGQHGIKKEWKKQNKSELEKDFHTNHFLISGEMY